MKVEILIVSWLKDLVWLEYNLKSIHKFATGFSGVTLLVPDVEAYGFGRAALHDLVKDLKVAFYMRTPDPAKWHLDHQVAKCFADIYCPDADFILHTDSDCVFTEPVTPEDYFVDGKPVMLIEEFARLPGNPWQKPTEKALGMPVPFETMRRHPQVNPRGIYADLRERIETVHGVPFRDYVLAQKADFPWGFSEHCTIGAFALRTRWKDAYLWIDVGAGWQRPPDKLAQFWSHSPPHLPQDLPSGGRGVPMDTFRRLGLG